MIQATYVIDGREVTPRLEVDELVRAHGRELYRVYVDGQLVGSVGRWEEARSWTVAATWMPERGRDEPRETFRTRDAAVALLLGCAVDFGPLMDT